MTLFYDNRMLTKSVFYCLRMCRAPELLYGKTKNTAQDFRKHRQEED
ncbi:Uncharacterised protein [uncultured Clostridium sp.]|nr:Uncharacterised protein [uncultured Clostridium sp.]